MRRLFLLCGWCLAGLILAGSVAAQQNPAAATAVLLFDFEQQAEVEAIARGFPAAQPVQIPALTGGGHALQFTLPAGRWVALRIGNLPVRDWSGFSHVEFDLSQTAGEVGPLYFWIYDDKKAGMNKKLEISETGKPMAVTVDIASMAGRENVDVKNVSFISLYISQNPSAKTYVLDRIRLVP